MVVKYLDFYSICLQLFCQTHWEDYRDLGGYSSLKLSSHRHIYICLSVCLSFCLPACLSVCILILRISKEHIPRQRLRLTSHLREWQEEKRRLAGGGKKESEEVLIGSGGSSRLSGTLPGQNEANKTRIFRQFLRINGTTGGALIRPFFGEGNEHDIDTKNYLL